MVYICPTRVKRRFRRKTSHHRKRQPRKCRQQNGGTHVVRSWLAEPCCGRSETDRYTMYLFGPTDESGSSDKPSLPNSKKGFAAWTRKKNAGNKKNTRLYNTSRGYGHLFSHHPIIGSFYVRYRWTNDSKSPFIVVRTTIYVSLLLNFQREK